MVQVDPPLIVAASALEEQHSLSFWDALIIEAAARAGAERLTNQGPVAAAGADRANYLLYALAAAYALTSPPPTEFGVP